MPFHPSTPCKAVHECIRIAYVRMRTNAGVYVLFSSSFHTLRNVLKQ